MSRTTHEGDAPSPTRRRARRRRPWWLRLLRGLGATVLGMVVVVIATVWILLARLESTAGKKQILSWLQSGIGIEAELDQLRLSLRSGLALEGLRVLSPPEDRARARYLFAADRIAIDWSLGDLVGSETVVRNIDVLGLRAEVVRDQGRFSLERWLDHLPSSPAPPSPPTPLSHLSRLLTLDHAVVAERIHVDPVGLRLLDVAADGQATVLTANLPAIDAHGRIGPDGTTAELDLAGPVVVEETRTDQAPKRLDVKLSIQLALDPAGLAASLALRDLRDQGLLDLPALAEVAGLEAKLAFQPAAAASELEARLRLADQAVAGNLRARLIDQPAGGAAAQIDQLDLALAVERLAGFIPPRIGKLEGAGTIKVTAMGVSLAPGRGAPMNDLLAGLGLPLSFIPTGGSGAGGRAALHIEGAVDRLAWSDAGRTRLTLPQLSLKLDLDGQRLDTRLGWPSLRYQGGGIAADIGALRLASTTRPTAPAGAAPAIRLEGKLPLEHVRLTLVPGGRVLVDRARLNLQADFTRDGNANFNLDLLLGRVAVNRPNGRPWLRPTSGKVNLEASDISFADGDLGRSLAKLRADVDLGPLRAHVDADKLADQITFRTHATARHLAQVEVLLPEDAGLDVPWDRIGLTLDSSGRLGLGAVPVIDQQTRVGLTDVTLRSGTLRAAARALDLDLASRGTATRHSLTLEARLTDLELNGRLAQGVQKIGLAGQLDLSRPQADLTLSGAGPAGPEGKLRLAVAWRGADRTLVYEVDGRLGRLGLLELLLPKDLRRQHRLAWDQLTVALRGRGELRGVVRGFPPTLTPVLEPKPLASLRGEQALRLELGGLDYQGEEERQLTIPSLVLDVNLREEASGKRHGEIDLDLGAGKLALGERHAEWQSLRPHLSIDADGAAAIDNAKAALEVRLGQLRQDWTRVYPIRDLRLTAQVRADARGRVRVENLHLDNPGGGTSLDLSGGIDVRSLARRGRKATSAAATAAADWVPGRRSVSFAGRLTQQLERLDGNPAELRGRGRVIVPLALESGDLRVFHARMALELEGLDLELPASGIVLRGINAVLPIEQELLLEGGVVPLGGTQLGAYPRLRFVDHLPFLSGKPFLRVERVHLPLNIDGHVLVIDAGPLAGNFHVDRNLVALEQMELRLASGGVVTGQLLLDWQGLDSRVLLRGAVTGVKSQGSDDRFDANLALNAVPGRLELEGKIEIIRLGRQHLLDLIDLWDPYRADVGMNRIRLALKFAYPRRVRLGFEQGFAAMSVDLGGLTRGIRIDDVRGLPLGPLLQRYLGPLLPTSAGPSREVQP